MTRIKQLMSVNRVVCVCVYLPCAATEVESVCVRTPSSRSPHTWPASRRSCSERNSSFGYLSQQRKKCSTVVYYLFFLSLLLFYRLLERKTIRLLVVVWREASSPTHQPKPLERRPERWGGGEAPPPRTSPSCPTPAPSGRSGTGPGSGPSPGNRWTHTPWPRGRWPSHPSAANRRRINITWGHQQLGSAQDAHSVDYWKSFLLVLEHFIWKVWKYTTRKYQFRKRQNNIIEDTQHWRDTHKIGQQNIEVFEPDTGCIIVIIIIHYQPQQK